MSFISDLLSGGLKGLAESASSIIKDFKASPDKLIDADVRIKELEIKAKELVNSLTISIEQETSKQLETVNQTIREEAKSEHWITYSWRPLVGYTFCLILINNYILLPYLKNYGIVPIVIPDSIFTAMLVILGASAATRGWEKVERAKTTFKRR